METILLRLNEGAEATVEATDGKVYDLQKVKNRKFVFDHFTLHCSLHFEDETGVHEAKIPDLRICLSNLGYKEAEDVSSSSI